MGFDQQISALRRRYGLSLAQMGSLVGAPAISVKRWEQGASPREPFAFQLHLVRGLIESPNDVFYDLARQGIQLNKDHWDGFAHLVEAVDGCIHVAKEAGFESPNVSEALVSGVKGLLRLIARSFAAGDELGEKASMILSTRIASILK